MDCQQQGIYLKVVMKILLATFFIQMSTYQYENSHCKELQSHICLLYNGNPYTWIDGIYINTDSGLFFQAAV